MDTIQFPIELREFLKSLSDHHVEYLLIGGYAVGYHGYPRATGDMDIWIAMNEANAEKIIAALEDFGFGETSISAELFLLPDQLIRYGQSTAPNRNSDDYFRLGFRRSLLKAGC